MVYGRATEKGVFDLKIEFVSLVNTFRGETHSNLGYYMRGISNEGRREIEDSKFRRNQSVYRKLRIIVPSLITIGIAAFIYWSHERKQFQIEYVPSILEDTLQNQTNTILDTVSGHPTKDSNHSESKEKGDL